MHHPGRIPLRSRGAGLLACVLILFAAAAAAQTPVGHQSAGGSEPITSAAEIKGLPPVDKGPMPPIQIDRPAAPKQVDPFLTSVTSNYQYDTGPMVDAPPLVRSFPGISDTGWLPPDPIIAAGPSHLVACVNSHIAYFNKSGSRLFQTSATSFFSKLGISGHKVFDPWVIYDEHVNRFMILFATKPYSTVVYDNFNLIAISKTPNPLRGWWLYKNDMTLNGSAKVKNWGDYPKLSTDRNGIYITANMYAFSGGFQYQKIRVLQNKAQLVNGNAGQSWWDFWDIRVSGSTTKAHTIQPCHDYDSKGSTAAAYFVSAVNGTGSNIYFYSMDNVTRRTPSGPGFYKSRVVVGSYRSPGNFTQKGGTEKIENVAPRLMNAVKRNGSVWTAHSVYQSSTASAARWYEFRVNSWPTSGAPTKRQEQSFWGSNLHYTFPSVAVNRSNDMAMVFCASGPTVYCGCRWTGRRSTMTVNLLESSAQLKAGEAYYVRKSRGRNRWGDYLGCAAAPDGSIWFLGQYAESNPSNKWGTWIGQVYPEPTYWVCNTSSGNTHGRKLLGLDTAGRITTSITLPSAVSPGSVCMDHGAQRVLVFDTNKIFRYYPETSSVFSSTLTTSGSISWGGVDENGGIFYVTGTGRLYRATSAFGAGATLVRYTSGAAYNAVAWDGHTGRYVAVTFGAGSSASRIHFIARDGTLLRNATGPSYMSGIDYDPFTGYFYISRFGSASSLTPRSLVRMTSTGSWSYLTSSSSSRLATANSVECREQPYARLYGVELGSSPQHVWWAYPTTGSPYIIHSSSSQIAPADLAINRQRVLWPRSRFPVGGTGYLNLNFGPLRAGDTYKIATALDHTPGFSVPNGWIHLVPDLFFTASILGWDGGAVWRDFTGFLDHSGRPTSSPRVVIPNITSLRGIRFYYAAVAYNPTEGIKAASNMCGVTFE